MAKITLPFPDKRMNPASRGLDGRRIRPAVGRWASDPKLLEAMLKLRGVLR